MKSHLFVAMTWRDTSAALDCLKVYCHNITKLLQCISSRDLLGLGLGQDPLPSDTKWTLETHRKGYSLTLCHIHIVLREFAHNASLKLEA